MKKKRIAVLVSGGGTNFQAILNSQASGEIISGEVVLVVSSNAEAFALERAALNGIDSVVVERKSMPDRREFTLAVEAVLDDYEIDLVVLAGFMCIFDESIFDKYGESMINVHPALIPSFSGAGYYGLHVHEAVLERGVKLTGASVHFVNALTDGGPIILQKAVPVCDNDTPEVLQERVMREAEWIILPQAVELFCAGKLHICDNWVCIK